MSLLRSSTAAALAALLSLPAEALSDDLSELTDLLDEPIVSTASKSAETADIAPATTSVISSDDLRRHGIASLDEAINFLAAGMITEPSYATPEIGARGVLLSGDYGNHVLLLLDGHALNEPWDGTAYYDRTAAIPLDLVDHIEVIVGPGSVLYGSSAMLGVINVITKRAKDFGGLHLAADGSYPLGARAAAGYGKQFELLGREGELTVAFDYYQLRGPNLSYGLQQYGGATWGGNATHRDVEVPAGNVRLVLGDFDVAFRAASSRRAATQIWLSFDDPNNWERDRWLSLDAKWKRTVSTHLALSLRLFGDLYDYLENAHSISSLDCLDGQEACVYKNSGVSRWGGAEANGTWDWLRDGRYVTLLGAEGRYRHVTSWTGFQDTATGDTSVVAPYDKAGTALGAYLQQTLRPARWLTINAGLRLDSDYQSGHSLSHVSPRVAAILSAWAGGTLKAVYSEAFRAPTFFERYYASTEWIAAPDLRPETVRSVETSIEQRLGGNRVRLGVFRSWWNDLVMQISLSEQDLAAAIARGQLGPGTTQAWAYANAGRVDSYGLSADWDGSAARQRLRYGAGITLAHSRQMNGAERTPLPAAGQVFGNARVSYDLGGRWPVLGLAGRVVGPRPISQTDFDPRPDARPRLELKGAVSGPIARGLSYRLSGTWALSNTSAYGVGPLKTPQPGYEAQALLPLPRYQLLFGLRYDQ